jgi:hypothetical protein
MKHEKLNYTPSIWESARNVSGDLAIFSGDRDLLNDPAIDLDSRIANLTLMQMASNMADALRMAGEGDLSLVEPTLKLIDFVHEGNREHFLKVDSKGQRRTPFTEGLRKRWGIPRDFPINNIEIQGCCEDGDDVEAGFNEEDADFISVYVHSTDDEWNLKVGATQCIRDFKDKDQALSFAEKLARAFGVEVHDYCD